MHALVSWRAERLHGAEPERTAAHVEQRWTAAGSRIGRTATCCPSSSAWNAPATDRDALRGRGEPWPIHQLQWDEISDIQRAFVLSSEKAGYKRVDDFDGCDVFGVGPAPVNNRASYRLLRSGVGPAADLGAFDIPMVGRR